MKILKWLAVALAGLLLLGGLLAGLALTPAVQTWAARRALAHLSGIKLQVGRVAAGLASADVRDVRLVRNGLVVTAGAIRVRYSAWDYLRERRINLADVTARNLVVDARAVRPAPAAPRTAGGKGSPPVALGLLALPRLPVDLRIDALAVTGRALLPGGRTVDFSLQGGGIGAGANGHLGWKLDFADASAGAALRAAQAAGTLEAHIRDDRRIDRMKLDNAATLQGPHLPSGRLRLQLATDQPAADGRETAVLQVAWEQGAAATPVLDSRMEYRPTARELGGTWKVSAQGGWLASLLAGFGLPAAAVDGSGSFTLHGTGRMAVAGTLQGGVDDLRRLGPAFAAVGPVRFHAAFDGGLAGDTAEIKRIDAGLVAADGGRLLQVTTDQPMSYDFARGRFLAGRSGTELARVAFDRLPLAWAQPVVKPVRIESGALSGTLALEADPDGRRAHLRTVAPLTLTDVTLRDSGRTLVKGMTLSLNPRVDYAASAIAAEVPDFRLNLPAGDVADAKLSVAIARPAKTPVVTFAVETRERLVSVLQPFLKFDPGPLTVESAVSGRWEGRLLHLDRVDGTVKTGRGALVASVTTLQPVTADLEAERFTAKHPGTAAARVRVGELPLVLAQAFLPQAKLKGALLGATLEIALPSRDAVSVTSTGPVRLRGVGLTLDGRPEVQRLEGEIDFTAARRGQKLSADVRRLDVREGSASLLSLTASGEATPGRLPTIAAKGRIEADLAGLAKQPALATLVAVSRGRLAASFDVTTAAAIRARASLAVRNLTAPGAGQVGHDLDLTLDAEVKPDASQGIVKLPFTLTVGRDRSDLALDGSFKRTGANLTFDGRLTSNRIEVDDFRSLAALLPSPPATAGEAPPASRPPAIATATPGGVAPTAPPADRVPFWHGISGRFQADLKDVRYSPTYAVSAIKGAVIVDPRRLALENLEGRFKDKPFKITAAMTFDAGNAQPYGLTGQVNVPDFDVGAFLRAADPGEPPAMESTVTVRGHIDGRGATPADLAENARGQFDVTGSKGVLRALGRRGEVAGVASALVGLFEAARGSHSSDTAVAVDQLAGLLQQMPFDKFSARVERGADLNLKLTSLEFVSPAVHLTGSGTVQYRRGVPMVAQPLQVRLQLAGKAEMATVLNRLHLLSGKTDAEGYYLMSSPFEVTGTLEKPDARQLWRMAGETAARAAIGRLLR